MSCVSHDVHDMVFFFISIQVQSPLRYLNIVLDGLLPVPVLGIMPEFRCLITTKFSNLWEFDIYPLLKEMWLVNVFFRFGGFSWESRLLPCEVRPIRNLVLGSLRSEVPKRCGRFIVVWVSRLTVKRFMHLLNCYLYYHGFMHISLNIFIHLSLVVKLFYVYWFHSFWYLLDQSHIHYHYLSIVCSRLFVYHFWFKFYNISLWLAFNYFCRYFMLTFKFQKRLMWWMLVDVFLALWSIQ